MDLSTIGNFLSNNSSTIGGLLSTGSQLYGQQNAGQAISSAANAGIGQANTTLGNINALYQPQTALGNGAMSTLGSSLGINGQPPNYNNFLNMPGYQFAVKQGTQAIQRQAAAMGNAYTPNTAQAVGQYVTGTAMQDYNNYISQLQNASQFGATANQNLTSANLQTAGNIEQLGMNSGMAQAGLYTGAGQTVAGGANSSGSGGASTLSSGVNLAGKGLSYLSSLFGGNSLAALASGAPANAAVTGALGSVGSQTAPLASSISAANDAALGSNAAGLGGATAGLTALGNIGSGLAANTAVTGALGSVGAQTAGTAAGIEAANDAALGGAASSGAAAGGGGAGAAAGGSVAGAVGAAAIPLAFAALAAFVPSSEEFTAKDIQNMENNVKSATIAPGQIDQKNWQALTDLSTLEYENPQEFAQSGIGTGPITQFLQSLGYSPVDWSKVSGAGVTAGGSGTAMGQGNNSGHQL